MNVVTMSVAETSRQESVERMSDGFSSGAAEHLLRRVVKQHHSLVLIHGDDRIHRGFNDAFQPEPADQELARLRARVAELEANERKLGAERDILRAAAKYFAGETRW